MTSQPAPPSKYTCQHPGCDRHPAKGDAIFRISPKGGPFKGLCQEHIKDYAGERRA